jgi:hypothetical protein
MGDSQLEAVMHVVKNQCDKHGVTAVGISTPGGFHIDRRNHAKRESKIRLLQGIADHVVSVGIENVLMVYSWSSVNDQREKGILEDLLNQFEENGVGVWILNSVPSYSHDVPTILARMELTNGELPPGLTVTRSEILEKRKMSDGIFSARTSELFRVFDPLAAFLDDEGKGLVQSEGRSLYYDQTHLSAYGTQRLAPYVEQIISAIVKNRGEPLSP